MELNLSPILNFDGKKMEIREEVALPPSENDSFSLKNPVCFEGYAQNISRTIELIGKASATVILTCDRCTESFDATIDFEIDERLKKEDLFSENDDPDIITFSGTSVDFDEIIYTNLYMNLPSKNLCNDNCKGLCPVCGKNLNLGDCGCETQSTDPRFDVLDKLL